MKASLVALIVLSSTATAMVLLPSATITIYPEVRTQQAELVLTLDPRAEAPGADGRVPARHWQGGARG
jgi:hypothetical protein